MSVRRTLTTSMGILALAAPLQAQTAAAGEIGDAFLEAESALLADDTVEMWAAFERATELFWAAAPLGFTTIELAEEVRGFGDYDPRPTNRFAPGDRLTIYVEPVGYGWTAIGDDFRIRFALDLTIETEAGVVLFSESGFASVERLTLTRGREFQATVTLALPELPPDRYRLLLTFRDAATGKDAVAAVGVVIE